MSKQKLFRAQDELDELEVLAEQEKREPALAALDTFLADGLIREVLYTVKSGKEATVYCCEASPSTGLDLVAAKVYRSRNRRVFKNDAIYQEGRVILKGHVRRAVENKSRFGREAQFAMWVNYEYEALKALHKTGADIPRPLARSDNAILMEYLGDREQAAPALQFVDLPKDEVYPVFAKIMDNIQLWLASDYVHADLSAYNVLYWQGRVSIIDFPQAIDPRFNPNALALLTRDIENICHYMARYGLQRDGQRLAERLWQRFRNAQL
ncbi:MAG TPA: RIO1 family regulatory kinase/ATPase [Ktedonobacteraceae bacterium]|nr:RIO1 family regulatory kinase/ATPase [Ktedonobacteraceae bacterium]